MTTEAYTITDNLDQLLDVLPEGLKEQIAPDERDSLIEIVLDLGRLPEARYLSRYQYLREAPITREDLDFVEARLGAFGNDNRAGIPATLHRISAMRNRRGTIVGMTLRVGRAVTGIVDILRDLIESGQSLLLMGRPGLGKTTLLREMAREMADEMGKRVVIVDTSNEIAGDGDVPHPAIGRARRMQVARVEQQHDVMIEAVENHMPEVVVIDEIGRSEETMAARTIAERGVQLVATVHGNTLANLLANPTMSDLVGGVQAVTLSDEEARRRGTQKTVLERKAPPTFDVVVEMIERGKMAVRRPVAEVVDGLLRGMEVPAELRWRDENGELHIEQAPVPEAAPRHRYDFEGPDSAPRGYGRGGRGREGRGYEGRGGRSGGGNGRPGSRSGPVGRAAGRGFLEVVPRENGRNGAHAEYPSEPDVQLATLSVGARLDNDPEYEPEPELTDAVDEQGGFTDALLSAAVDTSRVRRLYPFGVSRSRLTRAIKHLGLPVAVARTWKDADAVLLLAAGGLTPQSSFLREARELRLPIIGVRGNTYGDILARLGELYTEQNSDGQASPREFAVQEARNAVQRVLSEAEPVELRPQSKPLRRLQHQLAQRYHLRSYSVGRDPNRRVRFLPSLAR